MYKKVACNVHTNMVTFHYHSHNDPSYNYCSNSNQYISASIIRYNNHTKSNYDAYSINITFLIMTY